MKNVFGVIEKIVECASAFGICAAAREYSTARKTVRKRLSKYNRYGLKKLKDIPRYILIYVKASEVSVYRTLCSYGYMFYIVRI